LKHKKLACKNQFSCPEAMELSIVEERRTAGAVEETVPGLDGVVDSVGTGCVVDFPKAKSRT